jgi:hypothetical protein
MPVSISGTNGVTFPDSSLQAAAASPYVLKNRIINGAMVIDQRRAGASVTIPATTITYTVDRFFCYATQASKYSVQQNAGSVTPPVGFTNYAGITSLSAYSVTSTDEFNYAQTIEGFNIADLAWGTANAQAVTLSFWVRSSLTGTFGGSLKNNGNARSYPFSYTISSANTWEQKIITVAGDTTGTWLTNNGNGLTITFGLGQGSTFSGTASSWQTGNFTNVTGATSVVGTSGATFYITGVQLEIGSSATPFERRLYNQELAACQRYYQKTYDQSNIAGSTVGQLGSIFTSNPATNNYPNIGSWNFAVPMRAAPTVTGYNPNTGASGGFRGDSTNYTPLGITVIGERSAAFYGNNVSVPVNVFVSAHAVASAEL